MLNRCKTLLLIISLAALLLPNWAEAKKLNVITATTDLAALAQEVGGDKIQVEITEIDQRGKISLTPVENAADTEAAPAEPAAAE